MGKRVAVAQLAVVLRDAITRLNRRVRQTRPVGDLTLAQLSALASLELAGAMTPRELADTERVRPPTMTKIVARLEERGLVQRSPHPSDGRQVLLAATDRV
jgi:DNA-binding MarR family transcriptional regulator